MFCQIFDIAVDMELTLVQRGLIFVLESCRKLR